ncbi:gxcJ [Acrasis kona]|uniref:GxcJ n=1 Tax=Acrasis kona TaxID=1008807 RepID=A0AAW2YUR9_9EUKA
MSRLTNMFTSESSTWESDIVPPTQLGRSLRGMTHNPKKLSTRDSIFDELLESERYYVQNLEKLQNLYMLPMKQQSIVEDHIHNVMFQGIEQVIKSNKIFLQQLNMISGEDLTNDERFLHVAKLFKNSSKLFKSYSSALSGYGFSLELLTHLTSRKLKNFLNRVTVELMAQGHRVIGLDGFMIIPTQRLPRYMLILSEMASVPDLDAYVASELMEATDMMDDVIRMCMLESTSHQQMLTACRQFCRNDVIEMCRYVAPHRVLLLRGSAYLISEEPLLCELFLLTDILVVFEPLNQLVLSTIALVKGDICPSQNHVLKNVVVNQVTDYTIQICCHYEPNEADCRMWETNFLFHEDGVAEELKLKVGFCANADLMKARSRSSIVVRSKTTSSPFRLKRRNKSMFSQIRDSITLGHVH